VRLSFCIALCSAACLLAGALLPDAARAPRPRKHPVALGTFLQWFLAKDWDDARWQSEFRAMREVGMRILVFAPTVDSTHKRAYYPTQLPGHRQAEGYPDVVDACLRNAQAAGIQVFLGLNFHDDWWKKAVRDPAWLYAQMEEGNAVADELCRRYHARYPDAFHGWYWVWEVDNLNFKTPEQADVLTRALDINVRYLKALNPQMPVLLCPFMNARFGTPEAYQALWTQVFAKSALGRGDIFCPQDCVGAGGLTLEQVAPWFAALGKAAATKPGLRFWSDTETFSQDDWTSAPLDRFVAQMRTVQPYVEACLTFAYSHYYSPNVLSPGFQQTYKAYVETGRLEAEPPSTPTRLRAERQPDGTIELSWDAATDNIGVCGYYVYRNGVRISRRQTAREAAGATGRVIYLDKAALRDAELTYTVQAYDFAGNVSGKAERIARPSSVVEPK